MSINRRAFLASTAAFAAGVTPLRAQSISALGRDVTTFGVKPGSPDDQTRNLQRAIDEAAKTRVPLALPPGTYRSSTLTLREGTQLVGVRGATKIEFTGGGPSLLASDGASNIALSGLTLDGLGIPLPQRRGLVHCTNGKGVRMTDCDVDVRSAARGIWFEAYRGDVRGSSFTDISVTGHCVLRRGGPSHRPEHDERDRRQRHRDPASARRRRRHAW